MSLSSRALSRLAGLAPAETTRIGVERDLPMVADDGVVLLADRWYPLGTGRAGPAPIVLMRSPYGRRRLGPVARLFAERGYQVVVQSCRGTFGSAGEWLPFRNERADGRRCLAWLAEQPWWSGTLATFGPSYLGLVQWAVLADPPPALRAVALDVTASCFRDIVVYPGGTFALETGAAWLDLLDHQEAGVLELVSSRLSARRRLPAAGKTLPLAEAETAVIGHRVGFYQDWLVHERPGDPWWDPVDFGTKLDAVPPATLLAGWYDIFLPAQLRDYQALVAAGRTARLTVGPWTHASTAAALAGVRDALEWFDAELKGDPRRVRREPVRLFVQGEERWRELSAWPPPAITERWHLQPGRGLARDSPTPSTPDRYHFDPAAPTPSAGGPSLDAARAGRRDQAERERRSDVVCYSSTPFDGPYTVAGEVRAEIWLTASAWHTDLFVRVCDVDPAGRSTNVCDGILRLEPDGAGLRSLGAAGDGDVSLGADGVARVSVNLWPTAYTFGTGHRLRLQVSAAAHPLYARNLGGGERLGSGTVLVALDHVVHHDPEHPSALELPRSWL